jgi:predicted TIM-barrel fold metal-dependent hydrolase
MVSAFRPSDRVATIRARLEYPVIDSDGHLLEFLPLVRDNIVELADESVASRFDAMITRPRASRQHPVGEECRSRGLFQSAFWAVPTENTLDRATAILPQLLYQRLDQLGIDYALLYPSFGIGIVGLADEELRLAGSRAFNRYYADAYRDYRDRLEPVACIPMVTPQEAVNEIEYVVGELGLKAVMLMSVVNRPIPGDDNYPAAKWTDTLGHDSLYDYDPVWATCERLGVAATFHSGGMGWGSRASTQNYMYNHVGHFAAAGEAGARSLFFGGVPRRFPNLHFAFQEGGVAWACTLLSDILSHWSKRNRDAVRLYDPARFDGATFEQLFDQFADGRIRDLRDRMPYGLHFWSLPEDDESLIDEFAASGISKPEDVVDIFTRQYHFGCEADDPMNAMAFNTKLNPHGARLRAVFASDIGHWDVPDFRNVLPEAWELVEDGLLSEEEFAAFTFGHAVSLWAGAQPDFFRGTAVESAVEKWR